MSYEKKVMEQAYIILMKEDFEWTETFQDDMKLKLLNLLLEYFSDIEHYEKCSKLKPIINRLENVDENISKTTVTGSEES